MTLAVVVRKAPTSGIFGELNLFASNVLCTAIYAAYRAKTHFTNIWKVLYVCDRGMALTNNLDSALLRAEVPGLLVTSSIGNCLAAHLVLVFSICKARYGTDGEFVLNSCRIRVQITCSRRMVSTSILLGTGLDRDDNFFQLDLCRRFIRVSPIRERSLTIQAHRIAPCVILHVRPIRLDQSCHIYSISRGSHVACV